MVVRQLYPVVISYMILFLSIKTCTGCVHYEDIRVNPPCFCTVQPSGKLPVYNQMLPQKKESNTNENATGPYQSWSE